MGWGWNEIRGVDVNSLMEFACEPRLAAPPLDDGEISVDPPPEIPKAPPVNPLARLLPVVVVVATGGMMAVYFTSGASAMRSPMFMFMPVMMLTSVLGTFAFGGRGTTRTAELNHDRRAYLRYLGGLDLTALSMVDRQHRALAWNHPDPDVLWSLVGGRRMWERRPSDDDFCRVRTGLGEGQPAVRLSAPDLPSPDERDPVTTSALLGLIRRRSVVRDVPVTVALRAVRVLTLRGGEADGRALLRAMICQLVVMHSPDHVKVAAVVGPPAADEWDWLKWLPHHQHPRAVDGAGPARLVYRTLGEAERALAAVTDDGEAPHVVVILDGISPADVETRLAESRFTAGTLLVVGSCGSGAGASDASPDLDVDLDELTIRGGIVDRVLARADRLAPAEALQCARRLAAYRTADASSGRTPWAANGQGWPELMGLNDPACFDPDGHWRSADGRPRLRVPIGLSDDGSPVELDIKEAARDGMGPHGLCVGATGSGKSEFLRTLTLGMIATHPPDVLNLVLVDFKGGATFQGLERTRHVAALITNLAGDAHLVARMQDALAGEMNRRQELLRAAGSFTNTADYEDARAGNPALTPLPVLFIVVDEFSELLSQHPEFAELFVAIGRLGRSLGMHLLLASQRLDEGRLRGLETHLSYRICLKTFSASESRAVLGVPDAYHLPGSPGAAFLKTPSGELVRFQTAFVSGSYRLPGDTRVGQSGPTAAQVFTAVPVGDVIEPHETAGDRAVSTGTLLDVVVDRLQGHGASAHQVWLPPLTGSPPLDAVMSHGSRRGGLAVPIGLIDSPYQQRRDLLVAEVDGAAGNIAVVGAPRSGKSMALRTIVMSLAAAHGAAEVQFYCLDFGGGALSSLDRLPHVGAVAGRRDTDLCRRTVAELESLMRSREARFRRLGIDSVDDYRRLRRAEDPAVSDDRFGDVFLIVDGWTTLRQDFDGLEGSITALAAQGLSFGIHVVISASRWAEIRPALKDQIGTRIELRLGDPADSEMDRRQARRLSQAPPGRGITRDGREMVIALPRLDGCTTVDGLPEAFAAAVTRLRARWQADQAPRIELLPTRVDHDALVARPLRPSKEPLIGVGERELNCVAVDFAEHSHLLILGEGECGKTSMLRLLCREIIRNNGPDSAQLEIVDFRRTLLGVVETGHLAGYSMSPAGLVSRVAALLGRLADRMPGDAVTQQQLRSRSWWSGPEIYLVVDDYDLVAAASGNPLTPLADFLPHAKDLGLHLIVARRSGGAARAMFDPVLARLRDLGCMGLMMSASPEEGVLLGSVRPSALPPGRGTLITRGHPDQLIQVAWTDPP